MNLDQFAKETGRRGGRICEACRMFGGLPSVREEIIRHRALAHPTPWTTITKYLKQEWAYQGGWYSVRDHFLTHEKGVR